MAAVVSMLNKATGLDYIVCSLIQTVKATGKRGSAQWVDVPLYLQASDTVEQQGIISPARKYIVSTRNPAVYGLGSEPHASRPAAIQY